MFSAEGTKFIKVIAVAAVGTKNYALSTHRKI